MKRIQNIKGIKAIWHLLCMSIGLGGSSWAVGDFSQRLYQVELYIFSQGGNSGKRAEFWPEAPIIQPAIEPAELQVQLEDDVPVNSSSNTFPVTSMAVPAESMAAVDSAPVGSVSMQETVQGPVALIDGANYFPNFALVPQDNLKSPEILEALSSNRRYRLLFHAAWQQNVLSEQETVPILIQGGNLLQSGDALVQDGDTLSAVNELYELEGSVTFYLSRYLHIDSDIVLRDRALSEDVSQAQLGYYPMRTSRRMRSGEIHYLDHPVLGIVLVIHRV